MTGMTLIEFLTARLDEDEAVAQAAQESGGGDWWRSLEVWPKIGPNVYDLPDADQIARWSPARVLAEVEAKRRIVAEHGPQEVASLDRATWAQTFTVCRRCREGERQVVAPCLTLRLLALSYADHPDYDEAWRL